MFRHNLMVAIIAALALMLFCFWQISQTTSAQEKPLTLAEVLTGLQSKSSGLSTKQKNQYIIRRARQRGVSFSVTTEIETELRQAGASDELIEAIRSSRQTAVTTNSKQTPNNPSNEQKSLASFSQTLPGGVRLEMIYIKPGTFRREIQELFGRENQEVTIQNGFYIGKYEVTQEQWKAVMGNNPSYFKNCPRCPVDSVSWNDAKAFIKRLNAISKEYEYRLPSETEWEYAARAGTTTKYAFGEALSSSQANFNPKVYDKAAEGEYKGRTVQVGSYPPNAWGLHDMYGNIEEWVEDFYVEDLKYMPADGSPLLVRKDENARVLRGGSWYRNADTLEAGFRERMPPTYHSGRDLGFRLAANIK
jgi:formylglycine-generating enzyme required for sulfatase activity